MEDLSKDKSVNSGKHQAVVVGVSAGGVEVLKALLALLPADFTLPVVIVQHLHPQQDKFLIGYLGQSCMLPVREAEEKAAVTPGAVYFAPPNYHLMIESDKTFCLSVDEKVNFSRPSIDVLFETAAEAYGPGLIGIILTGASKDGAVGLQRIKQHGGTAIVQDPETAEFPAMPLAALQAAEVDFVLNITQVGQLLAAIGRSAECRGLETRK